MGSLLKLITKLFGKNALGKTLGTRTNVIKLPNNEKKRLIKNELDIERASDAAAQKVLEEAKELIPDLPKMNDMERLVFEGNLRRLDNRLNPPSAEVVEFGTKKPMSEAGIKQLAAEKGFPEGVDPESTMGRLLTSTRKLQDEAEKLKTQTPSQQFEDLLKNPYRSGGPLDPKSGIVRTAARQILRKKLDEGQIDIPDAAERDAIAKGYQGGVDPIEVFRKRFGEDPLQDLDEIADELNRARDFKEIDKILKRNKLFDIEPKKDYGYQEGSYTDEEMAELLKKSEEDPEGFATGGRVGFALGSLPKGIQALAKQLNKKFGKGTIKTADEMERPKSVKEKEMFEEFEARNPDPKRKLTDDEIKDYEEELGDSETWMSEGTVEEAEQALKRQKEYEAAMYTDYKAGRLDPQPGEKGRKEFLEKKLEEMEMSGDKKIMSVDEIEELSNMDLEAEMNVAKSLAPKMVERFELKQKYPGITDELLDKILIDDNMQRKAEVLATIDEAFKMLEKGMGHDEVLDTLKNVTRTKQAGGGLAYLMGL
jgi:tetratricopeptide (TPR) repeat protein